MSETLVDQKALAALAPLPNQTTGTAESKPDSPGHPTNSIPHTAQELWKNEKKPWAATPGGRLAIRSVSRGVIGAAFYTFGANKAVKDMAGYHGNSTPQNMLQHIARGIDIGIGKPLEWAFNKMGKDGKAMVSFRPSLKTGARTLGEDAIYNTFDFAMASAGDALGREIIGLFDPAKEKTWKGADGKIKFPQAVRSLVSASQRIFLAQAEDWCVAVPYTFQQKFQRKLINKFSPGFENTADSTLHGAMYKLDDKGNIRGTYALEGAIDLQARFTGYNFGTGLFRDMVGAVKSGHHNRIEKKEKGYEKPIEKTPQTMFRAGKTSARNVTRYLLNRLVKTAIIMTPSIPIFSALRIPQNRDRGLGLMPDGREVELWKRPDFDVSTVDRSGWNTTNRVLDKTLNPLGAAANKLSNGLGNIVAPLGGNTPEGKTRAREFARNYVNASMAYTPYIYAKNEFSNMWDNTHMNTAVDRVVDGVFNAKLKEIKEGAKDIAHVIRHKKSPKGRSFAEAVGGPSENTGSFVEKVQREQPQEGPSNWQEQLSAPRGSQLVHR